MYTIKPSPGKGLGVFATQAIERNDKIVHEPALLSQTNAEELEKGSRFKCLIDKFDQLDDNKKAQYLSLSHRVVGFDKETYDVLRYFINTTQPRIADDDYQKTFQELTRMLDVFNTNCAAMVKSNRLEGFGIFPIYSRINHSCIPNARWQYNYTVNEMEVHAVRDIADNEEITITYFPYDRSLSTFQDREWDCLLRGFQCDCEACADPDPDLRDGRRERMCELMGFFEDYNLGAFINEVELNPPFGTPEPIRLALELVKLLETEGLFGDSLAYACDLLCDFYCVLDQWDEWEKFAIKSNLNSPNPLSEIAIASTKDSETAGFNNEATGIAEGSST
ncbi:uncharacterized protein F4807DRAFT_468137 [Annulohypoxylon truncatum]|uniref:uncharacterized protein n=1 Tax=Annulohypoxylon truncatum TaxID=327061 RepID=UPI002007BC5B|nr:uncharacterized protein F4807DRAFT_468137 [Annulohypoxylon truncatum]KAI1214191.1 hypothetical protein F4807DRAFT_468137 [Annulohypoxylon truncatum]